MVNMARYMVEIGQGEREMSLVSNGVSFLKGVNLSISVAPRALRTEASVNFFSFYVIPPRLLVQRRERART